MARKKTSKRKVKASDGGEFQRLVQLGERCLQCDGVDDEPQADLSPRGYVTIKPRKFASLEALKASLGGDMEAFRKEVNDNLEKYFPVKKAQKKK